VAAELREQLVALRDPHVDDRRAARFGAGLGSRHELAARAARREERDVGGAGDRRPPPSETQE